MLHFYDFEVFKYDWLVVIIDPVGSLTQAHMGAVAEVRFILTHYFDVDASTFTAINRRLGK